MTQQAERLADALDALHKVTLDGIVKSEDLTRIHRERLIKAGFLEQIIRGWLLVTNPLHLPGATVPWYGAYWAFVAQYLRDRFGDEYCLSAETSIMRHVGSPVIPTQIIVMVSAKENNMLNTPHGTSLLMCHTPDLLPRRGRVNGIMTMDLAEAIYKLSEPFYRNNPSDIELALRMVRDPSDLLHYLLDGNSGVVAGRLVGAYEFLGDTRMSTGIKRAMEAAGNQVRVSNPFTRHAPMLSGRIRITSSHVARTQGLWNVMRDKVLNAFAGIAPRDISSKDYLTEIESRYAVDAYNSLSIEGYRVTPDLIDRVRRGDFNPAADKEDAQQRDVLAARGYYLAFQNVRDSIGKILGGQDAASVVEEDFQEWYRQMFTPAVTAGILEARQLAGYRNNSVYLRGSRYVPPGHDAVTDCMEAFLELLHSETEPVVRAVLGHFIFVYIHPYSDGNGRISRFLMNAGFASGRYPWTVIRIERRNAYLAALEEASINHDISPFAAFVVQEMRAVP